MYKACFRPGRAGGGVAGELQSRSITLRIRAVGESLSQSESGSRNSELSQRRTRIKVSSFGVRDPLEVTT